MKDPVSVVQRFHCIKRWFHVSSSISQDSVSPMNCTCRAMLTFYLHDWDLIKMTHSRSTSRCCSSTLWNVRVEREGWGRLEIGRVCGERRGAGRRERRTKGE